MSSRVQIDAVEAALLALLPGQLAANYVERVDVEALGKGDFDDDGQLVLKSPAVRISFGEAMYAQVRDTTRTTLSADLTFSAFCFHESIRSRAKERTKTLQLVAAVQDELAGARLQLTPGVYTEPILLRAVTQAADALGPVDQVFAVVFIVPGLAQFSGKNANFGAKS